VYLVGYVFFAMTVMQNMFLIIIEDSFMEVKDRGKFDWLANRKNRDEFKNKGEEGDSDSQGDDDGD
jgi:hypothetical protein